MTGDGAETILSAPQRADPVDMAMAVHHDGALRNGLSWRTNQLPLISAVPMRSEKALTGSGYSTR